MEWDIVIIATFLTSFIISLLFIPKIIQFSKVSRLFALAGKRDSHLGEIPIFGGIAIFLGILFSLIFWSEISEMQFILISVVIVFFIGLIDDLLSLSPFKKLIGQIISVLIIVFFDGLIIDNMQGVFGVYTLPYDWISILFTIFVVIVITNSYNLIDGIDGLAGGLGFIMSCMFGTIFILNGRSDLEFTILAFSLAGALLAFLRYNTHPATIFMGDTGSLVVGFILSVLSIRLINQGINLPDIHHFPEIHHFKERGPFVAIVILSIPLYDTFRVFFIRLLSGYNPLYADRNHIHHALLDLGFGHKKSAIILYSFSLIILPVSYFMIFLKQSLAIFILSIVVLACMAIPFILLRLRKKQSE